MYLMIKTHQVTSKTLQESKLSEDDLHRTTQQHHTKTCTVVVWLVPPADKALNYHLAHFTLMLAYYITRLHIICIQNI